jgi:hypothetical protein
MPARMLTEWRAFDGLEPISAGWRGDVQAGIVASTLANIYRDRGREAFEVSDFMPRFEERPRKRAEDLYAMLKTWAVLNGAKG